MRNQLLNSAKIIILAIVLSFGLSYAIAWTAPTAIPPAGNVSAPINTSATAQTKAGGLTVGSFTTTGAAIVGSLNAGNGSISTATNISGWGVLADHVIANNIILSSAGGSLQFYDNTSMNTAPTPHGKVKFPSSGLFTVPPGVTELWVTMSGGGGGGAGGGGYFPIISGSNGGASSIKRGVTTLVNADGGSAGTSAGGNGGLGSFGAVLGGKGVTYAYGTSNCLAQGGGNIFGSGGFSSRSGNNFGGQGNGYGGGGGANAATGGICLGGGGAGGAIIAQNIATTPSEVLTVTVGVGGPAGGAVGTTGGAPGAPGFVLVEW